MRKSTYGSKEPEQMPKRGFDLLSSWCTIGNGCILLWDTGLQKSSRPWRKGKINAKPP